ncbi:MAG: hypothetical protein IPG72_02105 [Ardenticatenales bacterium]|nr:hypothetical protein [Ardenticatenales bacterium]
MTKAAVADDRLTVASYLEHWLQNGCRNVQPSTGTHYESNVRVHIAPCLGRLRLSNSARVTSSN